MGIIIWIILIILIPGGFGTFLIIYPARFVQLQARAYRQIYRNNYALTDDQLERHSLLPTDRILIGSLRRFIDIAPEHPEEFGDYILVLRIFGFGLWGLMLFFLSRLFA